jgi:hypothetical protein
MKVKVLITPDVDLWEVDALVTMGIMPSQPFIVFWQSGNYTGICTGKQWKALNQ